MRVILSIANFSTFNSGAGGHYYSLFTLAKILHNNNCDVRILVFGDSIPPVFAQDLFNVTLIDACLNTSWVSEFSNSFKEFKPDIIHSFDPVSCFYSRRLSNEFSIKIVHTKPGGSDYKKIFNINFKVYTPEVNDIIVFSEENFKSLSKSTNSKVHLIPNRVLYYPEDIQRMIRLYNEVNGYDLRLLRICRISKAYKESILQTINLSDYLNSIGVKAIAVIVGVIQDYEVFDELKNRDNSIFFTSEEYYKDASRLIPSCEFNVGVGRGFMEACSYHRVMLTTLQGAQYPVLVDNENIFELFKTNFSPRNSLDDYNESSNLSKIKELVLSQDFSLSSTSSKQWFDDLFSIEAVVNKYFDVYSNSKVQPTYSLDYFIHWFRNLKTMYVHKRKLSMG